MKAKILTLAILAFFVFSLSLMSVSALTVESVDVSPREIEPGKTATIVITLENNLNEDVTDVSVSLDLSGVVTSEMPGVPSVTFDLPFAPYDSSSEVTKDEIEDGKNKDFRFEIIALSDAESGVYKIPLKISYLDEDEERHERESLIGVTVNSPPIIGVELEDGLLLKDQNNEVTLRVINKGLSDVKFLEVEAGKSTYYSLISKGSVYIGDIDSDDFDSVDFRLFFKEKTPSTVSMPVTITYRDITNKEYSEEFDVDLKVYSTEKALELGLIQKSKTTTYIGAAVVLIVLWIIYRKIKKRRQRKKAEAGGK